MNTIEIDIILKKALSNTFLGVFPIDIVPSIKQLPAALVVNLDPSNKPGSHWVALYFDNSGTCEYFDSYGRPPIELQSYILQNARSYVYNNVQVQHFSAVSCGHMCVYFLIWRAKHFSFIDIVQSMCNDKIYKYFLKTPGT